MRIIKENHRGISTILSFALIPLSGFATDIYIPSLPSMASYLHVGNTAVQLSLIVFMVSAGLSQLFIGSLLDSFGRFRLGITALALFALASFTIALSHSIELIYGMRIIQGITVATIVVGKRAYFVDIYSGERLKNYVSLFSIIWATAPIIAPFIGGYLQASFGWQSNFYFLGILTLIIMVLELKYGGESLQKFQPFKIKRITSVYISTIKTVDYSLGLLIIALSYAMLVVYGMTSPFIIEHVFHYSPVTTGYCSLASGISLMTGGIISKLLIRRPFFKKIMIAISLQVLFSILMVVTAGYMASLYTLMTFTLLIHLISGFVFNNVFAYCLGRFSKNAGMISGITGGSLYIITSILSYGLVNLAPIKNQAQLGGGFLAFSLLLSVIFLLFRNAKSIYARVSLSRAA